MHMNPDVSAHPSPQETTLFQPTVDTPDLWHYLQRAHTAGRPIVLYGMGNGADKILTVCAQYGIPVQDVFASDGFVRGHQFHGKTVLSYSAACEKYGRQNMIVLLSFASSRPDVLALIERVASEGELYAPDVPVCGDTCGTLFCHEYFLAHQEEINMTRALLADEESRRVLDGILAYKLSGRIDLLRATESDPEEALCHILHAARFETAVDLGAYNGDSIRALRAVSPQLRHVLAMEPDRRNFKKLQTYAASVAEGLTVEAIQAGAWNRSDTLYFNASGNRNAGLNTPATDRASVGMSAKLTEIPVCALDDILEGASPRPTRIDYIKYDVEGAEAEALEGSRRVLLRDHPALLVSVYHRSEDLFALPLLVHRLQPAYRLYLRRMPGVPAWDINLYATVEEA